MKVVFVYADSEEEWNSSEWRCAVPYRAINRSGRHQASLISIDNFAHHDPSADEICREADILVVERNLFGPVLSAIQYWKARDKVVLADFDDAYHLMHPSNPNYTFWSQGIRRDNGQKVEPPPLTQFKWGLRLVHAATTPSQRLAADWRAYTKMIYVPNYIDLNLYQNVQTQKHDGIIIGWGGSVSHYQSFVESGLIPALQRLCQARPQVRVMICGADLRIVKQLNLPKEQLIHVPWVPHDRWATVLSQFDIGIAPLAGEYDQRRSWIKVLEYMLMKIPWVASEGAPYEEFRSYGWLVQNTAQAWQRVLLDVVDHWEAYKKEASGEAYLVALSKTIDENIHLTLKQYAAIYEKVLGRPIAV
ncbi:MAG: hypothetical protein Kow0088_20830 [Anaerolineales bacterium]